MPVMRTPNPPVAGSHVIIRRTIDNWIRCEACGRFCEIVWPVVAGSLDGDVWSFVLCRQDHFALMEQAHKVNFSSGNRLAIELSGRAEITVDDIITGTPLTTAP